MSTLNFIEALRIALQKTKAYFDDNATTLTNNVDTLKSRVDMLTTLEEGSTTGDAELADIRVGVDGTIYENAGESVRSQISQLSEDVKDLKQNGVGTGTGTGWNAEQINKLCDILLEGFYGTNQIERIEDLRTDLLSTSSGGLESISVVYNGTIATISGLKSVNISYIGTSAVIGG